MKQKHLGYLWLWAYNPRESKLRQTVENAASSTLLLSAQHKPFFTLQQVTISSYRNIIWQDS